MGRETWAGNDGKTYEPPATLGSVAALENVALSFCTAAEQRFEASQVCPDVNLRAFAKAVSLHCHQNVVLGDT